MKIKSLNLVTTLFVLFIMCFLFSCIKRPEWVELGYISYTDYTVAQFNKLKSPVVLIGKTEKTHYKNYSVILKDANDTTIYLDESSDFARALGESHKVGDTLK